MSVGTPTYMFKVDRPTTYEAPSFEPLSRKLLFDSNGQYCLENMMKHFLKEGVLDPMDAEQIFITAAEIFRKEPNVIRIQDPITVVGDIHGQFHDMPALFQVGGDINSQPYLFLGDYVDRGCFSSEVILFLLAAKIRYPERITMLRGNHECRHLTNYFNTKKEFLFKYTPEVYEAMIEVFDTLPLVAILNKKFFCVHGGLSPDLNTIADIEKINRFRNPPKRGAMADLLWSDPMSDEAEAKNSSSGNSVLFAPNEERGCSYTYSFKATCNFLSANRLLCVIRAHEAQEEGYKLYKKTSAGFPSAICIFSAPNYCDSYNNKAAIVKFSNNSMNVKQFHSLEHPYYLPNFMNAFTWSLPYVGERVTEMIAAILQMGDSDLDEEDGGSSVSVPTPEQMALRNKLRAKVKAIAHMSRRFRSLREEYESLTALNGLIAGDLPQELIAKGPDALRNQYCSGNFFAVKEIDQRNEKLPPGFSDELL